MKIIKVLLTILLIVVGIGVALTLLGMIASVIHLVVILTVFYLIGLVVWKLAFQKSVEAKNIPPALADKSEQLAEAQRTLAEIKRQQRLKQ